MAERAVPCYRLGVTSRSPLCCLRPGLTAGLLLSLCLAASPGCRKDAPAGEAPTAPDRPGASEGSGSTSGADPAGEPPPVPSDSAANPGEEPGAADHVQRHLEFEAALAVVVQKLLETRHLRRRPVDDAVSEVAFAELIRGLDPARLFLLAEHVDTLGRWESKMDDQLAAGRLDLAQEAGALLDVRVRRVAGWIQELLKDPIDLERPGELQTDGEKRAWCRTDDELRERWAKVLQLRVLSMMEQLKEADEAMEGLEGAAPPDERPLETRAREKLRERYESRFVRRLQTTHMDRLERFVGALASAYDPHSSYLPPRRKEDFDIRMSGRLEGIGAVLRVDGHLIEVVRIVPGSASYRQGELQAGDHILAVAEASAEPQELVDMRLRDAVQLIRGPKGTEVRLTVRKPDGRTVVIPIVRDVVRIETTWARGAVLEHPRSPSAVGYIDLPSFYGTRGGQQGGRTSSGDVEQLLARFEADGVRRVILDLRSNSGGYLEDARRMGGLFIERGPIVITAGPGGDVKLLADRDPNIVYTGHVVVLVNRFSASASEIVAGALKDYGRAVVVGAGARTHGKGTVQTLLDLDRLSTVAGVPPLGVLKITNRQYYRINGESVQLRGIAPDIVLPDPTAHIDSGEQSLDNPIPWGRVDAEEFTRWTARGWTVERLAEQSVARRTSPAFALVSKRAELLRARRENTVWPLARTAWLARRERQEKELEALEPPEDAPDLFAAALTRYGATPPPPRGEDEKDPLEEWARALPKDPWLEEAIHVALDMSGAEAAP